jgi:hypothetical protein
VLLEGTFLRSAEDLRVGFRWEVGGEVRLVEGDCLMGGEAAGGGGVSVSRGSSSSGGRGSICMASVSAAFSFSGTSGEGGRWGAGMRLRFLDSERSTILSSEGCVPALRMSPSLRALSKTRLKEMWMASRRRGDRKPAPEPVSPICDSVSCVGDPQQKCGHPAEQRRWL